MGSVCVHQTRATVLLFTRIDNSLMIRLHRNATATCTRALYFLRFFLWKMFYSTIVSHYSRKVPPAERGRCSIVEHSSSSSGQHSSKCLCYNWLLQMNGDNPSRWGKSKWWRCSLGSFLLNRILPRCASPHVQKRRRWKAGRMWGLWCYW